jgi:hypothetical protein
MTARTGGRAWPARAARGLALAALAALAGCDSRAAPAGRGPASAALAAAQAPAPPPDPRVVCPSDATQRRYELTVWCEDENGRRHGPRKVWDQAGRLVEDERYIHGAFQDPRITCPPGGAQKRLDPHPPDDVLTIWCVDEDGYRQGPMRSWYRNGQLSDEQPYADGFPDGLHRFWYEDGTLEGESTRVKGKLEGPFRRWHPNGKLESEIRFHDGKAIGIGRWWDERGRLVDTWNYAKGPYPGPRERKR